MIRNLRIRNFKLWQDTGNIKMSPITLFFGSNSSGKSSIGQFLMMLRQTIDSPDQKAVFQPGDRNTAVQLGSFKEMILHRDESLKLDFEYAWDLIQELKIKDPNEGKTFSGSQVRFSAQAAKYNGDNAVSIANFQYQLLDKNADVLSVDMKRKSEKRSEYDVDATPLKMIRNRGRVWHPSQPIRFYGFPDSVVAYHKNADFVQNFNFCHEQLFKQIFYLGPLRTKTDRIYTFGGVTPEHVGYSGEYAIAALIAAKERIINSPKKKGQLFQHIIAQKLKDMGLIDEMKIEQIADQRQDYLVRVRTQGTDFVDLPDVGIGVSQVLPVLIQCYCAPANSILIFEQPEIHLHPNAQSALADVLIDAISAREKGKPRNIQLIIETHSEHFLRRLMRRIAENEIDKNAVSAYFASVSDHRAKLNALDIDLFGNIRNWPEHFFGDEMGDIIAQSEAALKRSRKVEGKNEEK